MWPVVWILSTVLQINQSIRITFAAAQGYKPKVHENLVISRELVQRGEQSHLLNVIETSYLSKSKISLERSWLSNQEEKNHSKLKNGQGVYLLDILKELIINASKITVVISVTLKLMQSQWPQRESSVEFIDIRELSSRKVVHSSYYNAIRQAEDWKSDVSYLDSE